MKGNYVGRIGLAVVLSVVTIWMGCSTAWIGEAESIVAAVVIAASVVVAGPDSGTRARNASLISPAIWSALAPITTCNDVVEGHAELAAATEFAEAAARIGHTVHIAEIHVPYEGDQPRLLNQTIDPDSVAEAERAADEKAARDEDERKKANRRKASSRKAPPRGEAAAPEAAENMPKEAAEAK